MIVGYPAGSATDAAARVVTGPLAKKLGQPVIIENRGGADGMIAGRAIARSDANGYTMGFSTTTSWALALNMQPQQMGFDPRKDFASVSLLGDTHYLLIVNADLGVNSVADLVALAKRSKVGALNFSSTGDGSIAHLGMLIIAKKLGIEMTHVPYKSTAQSIIDVASGVIQLQLATISPTVPLVHAGKVRVLGIASDRRSPLMPDVPTLAEQGAATTASFSLGFVFPSGTPDGDRETLERSLSRNPAGRSREGRHCSSRESSRGLRRQPKWPDISKLRSMATRRSSANSQSSSSEPPAVATARELTASIKETK